MIHLGFGGWFIAVTILSFFLGVGLSTIKLKDGIPGYCLIYGLMFILAEMFLLPVRFHDEFSAQMQVSLPVQLFEHLSSTALHAATPLVAAAVGWLLGFLPLELWKRASRTITPKADFQSEVSLPESAD